jgi:hypothetical protein
MSAASRSRARGLQAKRGVASKRKQRAVGAAITTVLLVAIVGVVVLILANPTKYRVTQAVNRDLVQSMSSVPATDVSGADPVPRPPGTVRSYFMIRGRVTTAMYVSHQALRDEQTAMVNQLVAAGWKAPNNLNPGTVATEKDSFTAVYASSDAVLQVALVRIKDITAATYIIQSAK